MAGFKHNKCSKPAIGHQMRPVEHRGVERGTLSTTRRAASAASCGSNTSNKLLPIATDLLDK